MQSATIGSGFRTAAGTVRTMRRSSTDADLFRSLSKRKYVPFEAVLRAQLDARVEFPKLLDGFQKAYGGIVRYRVWPEVKAGAALTLKGAILGPLAYRSKRVYLHSVAPEGDSEIFRLMNEVERLRIDADDLLLGRDRRTALERLYRVVESLLSIAGNRTERTEGLASVREELCSVQRDVEHASGRASVINYLAGIGLGLGGLAILGVLLMNLFKIDSQTASPIFVAGGVGAVVSVMWRMSSGRNFAMPHHLGRLHTVILGAFRPALGAISSLVAFFFLSSGLISMPEISPESQIYYFLLIGFLMGFSERLARNMFVAAENAATPDFARENNRSAE